MLTTFCRLYWEKGFELQSFIKNNKNYFERLKEMTKCITLFFPNYDQDKNDKNGFVYIQLCFFHKTLLNHLNDLFNCFQKVY